MQGKNASFSIIHKIRRDDKGKLQLQGTLSSLVSVKLNLASYPGGRPGYEAKLNIPETKEHPCYTFQPTQTPLNLAKKATAKKNVPQKTVLRHAYATLCISALCLLKAKRVAHR